MYHSQPVIKEKSGRVGTKKVGKLLRTFQLSPLSWINLVCCLTTTVSIAMETSLKRACIRAAKAMSIATLTKATKAMVLCCCLYVHSLFQHCYLFKTL